MIGEHEGSPFLFMELTQGRTLVRLGRYDADFVAIAELPSAIPPSEPRMRLDPRFEVLVEDPRFAERLKQADCPGGELTGHRSREEFRSKAACERARSRMTP